MFRVRFAPSPTGFLHIGSARTFIFNWLYARRHGGTVILRIDDTDAERNTEASLQSIYEGLRWLDLGWDEEYKASDRVDSHREAAEANGDIFAGYFDLPELVAAAVHELEPALAAGAARGLSSCLFVERR